MPRARSVAMLIAALAVTGAGILTDVDPTAGPGGRRLTADKLESRADPAVTEAGAPPCPVAVYGVSPVATLSAATARCLGSVQPLDVGAVVAGGPTLLHLWSSSWCAPCREEMPVLDQYKDTPGAVRVIGINVRDRPAPAAAFVRDLKIGYPSLTDAEAVAGALGAPQLLPLSYLVDTDGSVRRLPMTVFRGVEEVAATVAKTREGRHTS